MFPKRYFLKTYFVGAYWLPVSGSGIAALQIVRKYVLVFMARKPKIKFETYGKK